MKIIAACGNGMGTSMIIKLKLEQVLRKNKIIATVEAMSVGQAKGQAAVADIIICSKYLMDQFRSDQKAKIIGVVNLMDENEIEREIKKAL